MQTRRPRMPRVPTAGLLTSAGLAVTLALVGVACSGSSPDEDAAKKSKDDALVNGVPTTTGQLSAVIAIGVGGALEQGCSATRIGTRHVLTAAHCGIQAGGDYQWQPANAGVAGTTLHVDAVALAPGWDFTQLASSGRDLAVITLSAATSLPDTIRIAAIRTTAPVASETVTMTGFGCETLDGQWPAGDHRLTFRDVSVSAVGGAGDTQVYTAFSSGATGTTGARLCRVDSGGPLLAHDPSRSKEVIVGVNSWEVDGTTPAGDKIATNAFTRTDLFATWLASLGVTDPQCALSVPPNATPSNTACAQPGFFPRYDSVNGAATGAAACAKRAGDFWAWCGLPSTQPVTARFGLASTRTYPRCVVSSTGTCAVKDGAGNNLTYPRILDAIADETSCLASAANWMNFCGTHGTVTATFNPTGASKTVQSCTINSKGSCTGRGVTFPRVNAVESAATCDGVAGWYFNYCALSPTDPVSSVLDSTGATHVYPRCATISTGTCVVSDVSYSYPRIEDWYTDQTSCLNRAQAWMSYCQTKSPVTTYFNATGASRTVQP